MHFGNTGLPVIYKHCEKGSDSALLSSSENTTETASQPNADNIIHTVCSSEKTASKTLANQPSAQRYPIIASIAVKYYCLSQLWFVHGYSSSEGDIPLQYGALWSLVQVSWIRKRESLCSSLRLSETMCFMSGKTAWTIVHYLGSEWLLSFLQGSLS